MSRLYPHTDIAMVEEEVRRERLSLPMVRRTIPEPVRAWARPVLAFIGFTVVIAAVMLAGVTAVLNLGTVAGIGVTMLLAAVGVGTGVWWIDRKGLL